jgi:predicted nucleic acid-binding protein
MRLSREKKIPTLNFAKNAKFRMGHPPELAALIEPVEVHFQWRPQSRDPNDEMVLEAAINGQADALVNYNIKDFRRGRGAL